MDDQNMFIIAEVPFSVEQEDFLKRIRVSPGDELAGSARLFIEWGAPLVKPKAIYRVSYIDDRSNDTVRLDGKVFSSAVLSANLKSVERVFPFIATCGDELDEKPYDPDPFMGPFWLDALKEYALGSAVRAMQREIKERFAVDQFVSMNPGSADVDVWPIEQQQELFSLFGDVKSHIGVTLTESFLMLPNKSVSGIYFQTDVSWINCQLCTREVCPSRRAKYTGTTA